MEVSATLRHARLSPQKTRLVADQLRGLPVERAIEILSFARPKAASTLKKVLESAIANAEPVWSGWLCVTRMYSMSVRSRPIDLTYSSTLLVSPGDPEATSASESLPSIR